MENNLKKPFNKRAFVSISMFSSGMILPLSGIMNHRLQLETLSSQRHFWMSVHNSATTLFLGSLLCHLAYNWRAMMGYIRRSKVAFVSKETLYALLLVMFVVALFSSHVFHVR